MPRQQNQAATIIGALTSVTIRNRLLVIEPRLSIPVCAPAALHDASMLLLLVLHDSQIEQLELTPLDPKAFSLCDGALIYKLSQDRAKALSELKTLALMFQVIDWEVSFDEMQMRR